GKSSALPFLRLCQANRPSTRPSCHRLHRVILEDDSSQRRACRTLPYILQNSWKRRYRQALDDLATTVYPPERKNSSHRLPTSKLLLTYQVAQEIFRRCK